MSSYKRNEIWNDIPGIGTLFIDEILVYANEPLLFVCKDGIGHDRYLVMTYDFYDSEFVISKIKPHILCRMLKNEIPMDAAFRSTSSIVLTRMVDDRFEFKEYPSNQFDSEMLPQSGTYFELKHNFIDRYISDLEKLPQEIQNYDLNIQIENITSDVNYVLDNGYSKSECNLICGLSSNMSMHEYNNTAA